MTTPTSGSGWNGSRVRLVIPGIALLSLVWALAPAAPPAGAMTSPTAPVAVVRVNQLGYPVGVSKRAYLMTPAPAAGSMFEVVDQHGTVVFRAPIGADQHAWSNAYPFVYTLDFDAFNRAGSYHLAIKGAYTVSSPVFQVADAGQLYRQALVNALSYYQNSRDGAQYIPSALRTAPGHLNDAHAMTYLTPKVNGNGVFAQDLTSLGQTIDASGGWWDAGDFIKFVETTSYVVAMMGAGVRDFPGQMGSSAGGSNFTAEFKFGLDFIQRMWDDTTRTLYYQVGIGAGNKAGTILSDHDIWRLPQVDDNYRPSDPTFKYIRNRPVFRAGPAGSPISPNLAGRLAADMGLCFQLFKTTDPAYADRCLQSGEHIFDMANTSPGQLLTTVPFGFYGESEWRDDLELGATELSLALASRDLPPGLAHRDAGYYLGQAAHWAHAYITGPNDAGDTLNLYDDSGLSHYELFNAITAAGDPAGLEVTKTQLVADLKKQLDRGVALAANDPFGFGFPWDTFDTTTHGAGLAVTAGEYDRLTHTKAYAGYQTRWLGNILGANAWGASLIVGDGSTFPECIHNQVANLVGSHNGTSPVLAGAAVEGPNSMSVKTLVWGMRFCPANGVDEFGPFNGFTAVFRDHMTSWATVEPAIDLTVTSPLAFAWQVAG